MKTYPSIDHSSLVVPFAESGQTWFVFDKLDGSNIRAEWNPKKGFYKFGTRTRMLGEDDPQFGEAIGLIRAKYEAGMSDVCGAQKYESAVAFFEFYGPNSFAGNHFDEKHDVTLFDVSAYKKGLLMPKEFVTLFERLGIPEILHVGPVNADFIESVKNGTLPGITLEGVVCKSKPGNKKPEPLMFKVKTEAWLAKLKRHCGNDAKMFEMLR